MPFVGHVRGLRQRLIQTLHLPEVKVLTGVRRGGKTTLLYQVMQVLMERDKSAACCLYVNFEDPALAPSLSAELIAQIKSHLANYLKWGGFPEVVKRQEHERSQLLKQYFEDIINKDIIARHNVRDSFGLRKLAAYLLQNTGNPLSFSSLQKSLGLHKNTVQEYLSYFTDAYLLQQALFFAFSLRKSMANNRKVYAGDTGLRNAASVQFTPDLGRLAENVAYLHLRQTFNEIYYWKNRQEVDFIAVEGDKLLPVNVCYTEAVPAREEKGLRDFLKNYKSPHALLISEERYGHEAGEHGEIVHVPLWYFLLRSPAQSEVDR
jgi:hypothetical protein